MKNQYSRNKTEYIHGYSDEEQHRLSLLNKVLNQRSLKALNIKQGEHILDVGSGLGQFTREMAKATGKNGMVLGIEYDQTQIKKAEDLALEVGENELVEFRQGNALNLPLREDEKNSFDLVFARFVLEHLREPFSVVLEMKNAVKPGGRIVLIDDDYANFRLYPESVGFSTLWTAYNRLFDRLGNDPYIGRRLVKFLYESGAQQVRNDCIFFGGCAGQKTFPILVENLIGVLQGASQMMIKEELINKNSFNDSIKDLRKWSKNPVAAFWHPINYAEGMY